MLNELAEALYKHEEVDKISPSEQPADDEKQVESKTPKDPPKNQFKFGAGVLSIRYGGKDLRPIKLSVGLQYIATLLNAPGRFFSADEILQEAGRLPPEEGSTIHEDSEAMAFQEGLECESNADEILDEEGRQAYKKKIAELIDEIDEANAAGQPEKANRLRQEKEDIEQQLHDACQPGGKSKTFRNNLSRKKDAIRQAISRAIVEIYELDKGLEKHLRQSIKPITFPCAYRPVEPTTWAVIF